MELVWGSKSCACSSCVAGGNSNIEAGHRDTAVAIGRQIGDQRLAATQTVYETRGVGNRDVARVNCLDDEKAKSFAIEEAELNRTPRAQVITF